MIYFLPSIIFALFLIFQYIMYIRQDRKNMKEQIEKMDLLIGKANEYLKRSRDGKENN